MKRLTAVGVALVVMSAAACGSGDATPFPIPSGTVVTETFTGTVPLPINGALQADIHNSMVTVGGSLNVTLTAAGPPPTITMLLAVGNPSSTGTCSSAGARRRSPPFPRISGTVDAGACCRRPVSATRYSRSRTGDGGAVATPLITP